MRANRSTLVKLCLLTALAVPVQRAASATIQTSGLTRSQAETSFLLAQDVEFDAPASLDGADELLIDGSSSMRSMNEALSEQFEARYDSAAVESAENGTDVAIDRLLNGEIDLAAIGRPLTEGEKAAGLVAVPIAREKIAVFVSPENPFSGDITFEEFGGIFRGEITEWEDVDDGSGAGPLRFVDRPESSDTRLAFRPYPVFQAAPFQTGFTADPVATDETEAVIDALGEDGIGYAIANQVMGNPNVKIVPMHQTLPDNPAYPFSQPRNYVYLGEPSPAVAGFLAVATSPEGVETIEAVRETEGAAAAQLEAPAQSVTSPDGSLTARTDDNNVAVIEDVDGNLVAGPLAGAGGAVTALAFSPDGETLATGTQTGKVRYWGVDGEPKGEVFDAVTGEDNAVTALEFQDNETLKVSGSNGRVGLWGLNGLPPGETAGAAGAAAASTGNGDFPWWLLWIPLLGLLGGLGLWLIGKGRKETIAEPKRQTAPTATVTPPVSDPDSDREVSSRAQTVISTDRVVDESRVVGATGAAGVAGAVGAAGIAGAAAARSGADNAGSALGDVTSSAREIGTASIGAEDISTAGIQESTDLESPNMEGTNLDLSAPDTGIGLGAGLGIGAAAGAAAVGAGLAAGGLDAGVETDDDDDEWDDNLDLTLDDAPIETGSVATDSGAIAADEIAPSEIADAMPSVATDSADVTGLGETISSETSSAAMPFAGDSSSADTANVDEDDFWNTSSADAGATGLGVAGVGVAGVGAAGIGAAAVAMGTSGDGTDGDSTDGDAGTPSEVTSDANTQDADPGSADPGSADPGSTDPESATLASSLDLDSIEPTRDTVIAETDAIPDIDPDENTIIGEGAVIFGGAAASNADAAAASSQDSLSSGASEAVVGSADSADSAGLDDFASSGILSSATAAVGIAGGAAATVAMSNTDDSDSNRDNSSAGGSGVNEDAMSRGAIGNESSSTSEAVAATDAATGAALGAATGAAGAGLNASTSTRRSLTPEELADVDDSLSELPDGYGESRIVLLPRDPKWAYAYWDVSNEHKQTLRDQGGQRLMLRLYDVTDIDQGSQAAHGMQQFDCDEMVRSWYVEIPVSDRDYTAELGYLTADERWLVLARSAPMRVPPIYPSDWVKDQFVTIGFDESLTGRTFGDLGRPGVKGAPGDTPATDLPPIYSELFAMTQGQNALWVAGSLFGSMHQVPPGALTQSGMVSGAGAALNASGLNMSGLNVSGLNMSGVGMGDRKRNFWLVADAELIVYGATEPDATLTIGDQVVPLSADGTFRFQVHFPDGNLNYPIKAVAADGEQSRSITMKFDRGTPERNTNTKEEAQDEWF